MNLYKITLKGTSKVSSSDVYVQAENTIVAVAIVQDAVRERNIKYAYPISEEVSNIEILAQDTAEYPLDRFLR